MKNLITFLLVILSSISYSQVNNLVIPIRTQNSIDDNPLLYQSLVIRTNTNKTAKLNKRNNMKYYLEKVNYFKKDNLNNLKLYKYNEFVYDSNENELSDEEYVKSGNTTFKKSKKIKKIYDSNNNLIQKLKYKGNNTVWTKSIKYEYTYDRNRNVLKEKRYLWDGAWKKIINRSYTYNTNNLVTSVENLLWDSQKNRWVGDTINDFILHYLETYPKREYTYFNDGKRKSEIYYTWNFDTNDWDYYVKIEYEKLNELSYKSRVYNFRSNIWDESSYDVWNYDTINNIEYLRNLYSYDSEGNWMISKFNMSVDSLGNVTHFKSEQRLKPEDDWIVVFKDFKEFDGNSNIISDEFYNNNELLLDEVWGYGSYSKTYTYDSNENVDSYIHHDWDIENEEWAEKIKNTYTYENADTISDIVLTGTFYDIVSEFYIPNYVEAKPMLELLKHRVLTHDTYKLKNNQWKISERIEFIYSRANFLDEPDINKLVDIKIYPNPAKNKINLKYNNHSNYHFSLYTITGKRLSNTLINNDNSEIDISNLNRGMYILKSTNIYDGKVSTLKFIKN